MKDFKNVNKNSNQAFKGGNKASKKKKLNNKKGRQKFTPNYR